MGLNRQAYPRLEVLFKKRDRTLREVSPEALICRTDFERFRQYVCNHESPTHHKRWINILNTHEDSKCLHGIGGKHTLILSPRGSAKSSFTVEWTAWAIGVHTAPIYKLPIKVLYVSYSVEVAMLKSEQIQQIIASPRYQEVFPWVRPGVKWGQKIWDIDKAHAQLPKIGEPYTLACAGMKGAVASKRAHLAIFDDLLKSPEQIENPTIRDRMAGNWSNVIRPVLYEGARAICLGTRMRADDIYETTFTQERDWNVIEESAIVEDDETGEEKSYWEAMHSLNHLQFLREDDPIAFMLQFQNKIPQEGEGIFQPDMWIEGTPPDLDEFDSICVGSDFSASQRETADYTVFILFGKKGHEYWVLDMRRGRWSGNIDKCNVLLAMLCEWGILENDTDYSVDYRTGKVDWHLDLPTDVPIIRPTHHYVTFFSEAMSYQVSFQADWTNYVLNQIGIWTITCYPLQLKGDKIQRLRGVTGVLQRRQVMVNRFSKLKRLKDELMSSLSKDDCRDAYVMGLSGMGARPNIGMAS